MKFVQNLFVLFTLLLCTAANSQSIKLSDKAEVSILTCGLGNEMYSLFGHTAIRISDPVQNFDVVYNYGAFDFNTPNFVAKFSKGDLQYFVTSDRFEDFIYAYNYEQRSVWEQQLAMTPFQKQQLLDELNATMASEKRFYTYKFIDRNCTTMVVELINRILGEPVLAKIKDTDLTYREVLYPYFDNHFYEQLGTSIIFGTKVDQKAEKIFLPIELLQSIEIAQINGKPLMKTAKTWMEFEVPEPVDGWWNNPITYFVLVMLVVVSKSRGVTMIYWIFLGAIGLFFTVAGLYSYHGELACNYNALLFNPVLLLMVYFMLLKNDRAIYYTSIFLIICIAIYLIWMVNKIHLIIILPVLVGQLIILGRLVLNYRKTQLRAATAH